MLLERIELSTSPLPRECSTSELQQRRGRVSNCKFRGAQGLSGRVFHAAIDRGMTDKKSPSGGAKQATTREDRLKAALKANMARRKAQARARSTSSAPKHGTGETPEEAGNED